MWVGYAGGGGGYVARILKTRNAYTFSLVGMEFKCRLDWQILRRCGNGLCCEV
jgi:hypothetical protein